MSQLATVASTIFKRAGNAPRFVVAIAGPPASGKSTRAESLVKLFPQGNAAAVSMDGFHYDDALLHRLNLKDRKGAPETFDFGGFFSLLQRLKAGETNVAVPVFDRSMELSRNAAVMVGSDVRFIIVEGNYLLLDEAPWRSLEQVFDFAIFVDVARDELERRLVQRWRDHGRDDQEARHWIDSNDLPNIDRVLRSRRKADLVL